MNATAAYLRAGYKPKSDKIAAAAASELLGLPKVAAAVAERRVTLALKLEISAERVLQEYALVAFSDIGLILDFSGTDPRLRPACEITEEARRTIASLKATRHTEGAGDDALEVEVTEFKQWNKLDALAKLGQHLGLFVSKHEHSGPGGKAIPIEIVGIEVVPPATAQP